MSRNFQLLIDGDVSAQAVRDDLVNSHGLAPNSDGRLVGPRLRAAVRPSAEGDEFLAEPGIANPTVTVTLMPRRLQPGDDDDAADRAIFTLAASLLRSFRGDAALTAQDASTCLLRIDEVVHVDRYQVPEEWLSADDVAPSPLVVGIPTIAE